MALSKKQINKIENQMAKNMAQIAFFYESSHGLDHNDFLNIVLKHCKNLYDYMVFSYNFAKENPGYAKKHRVEFYCPNIYD